MHIILSSSHIFFPVNHVSLIQKMHARTYTYTLHLVHNYKVAHGALYMYVYIFIYIYTYLYTYLSIIIHIYIYRGRDRDCDRTPEGLSLCGMYVCACVHVYVCVCTVSVCMCVFVCVPCLIVYRCVSRPVRTPKQHYLHRYRHSLKYISNIDRTISQFKSLLIEMTSTLCL